MTHLARSPIAWPIAPFLLAESAARAEGIVRIQNPPARVGVCGPA